MPKIRHDIPILYDWPNLLQKGISERWSWSKWANKRIMKVGSYFITRFLYVWCILINWWKIGNRDPTWTFNYFWYDLCMRRDKLLGNILSKIKHMLKMQTNNIKLKKVKYSTTMNLTFIFSFKLNFVLYSFSLSWG